MRVGVSPGMAKHFPQFENVVEHEHELFDLTVCHASERESYWFVSRGRRIRPMFFANHEKAESVLRALQVLKED